MRWGPSKQKLRQCWRYLTLLAYRFILLQTFKLSTQARVSELQFTDFDSVVNVVKNYFIRLYKQNLHSTFCCKYGKRNVEKKQTEAAVFYLWLEISALIYFHWTPIALEAINWLLTNSASCFWGNFWSCCHKSLRKHSLSLRGCSFSVRNSSAINLCQTFNKLTSTVEILSH